jgi:hypothetical protein
MNCTACTLERKNIKVSNPPKHDCLKGSPDYVEPLTRAIKDGETHIQFFVVKEVFRTNKAYKFQCSVQIANGFRVSTGTEIWLPIHCFFHDENYTNQKRKRVLWIAKSYYDKLSFIS